MTARAARVGVGAVCAHSPFTGTRQWGVRGDHLTRPDRWHAGLKQNDINRNRPEMIQAAGRGTMQVMFNPRQKGLLS
ncbi:MAG: hypothetical protein U1D28_06095 [Burkholderiales bacterium]|nr:hypothetical protein [Burkholderiales bacterium]